jgi:hypothetical protein
VHVPLAARKQRRVGVAERAVVLSERFGRRDERVRAPRRRGEKREHRDSDEDGADTTGTRRIQGKNEGFLTLVGNTAQNDTSVRSTKGGFGGGSDTGEGCTWRSTAPTSAA